MVLTSGYKRDVFFQVMSKAMCDKYVFGLFSLVPGTSLLKTLGISRPIRVFCMLMRWLVAGGP